MSTPEEIIHLATLGCEVDLIASGALPVANKRKAVVQAIQTYMVERDVAAATAAARVTATAAAKAKEPAITAAVNALLPASWFGWW